MGSVYRAEDTKLGREVAIKVLPEAVTEDAERLARFEREAQILATLNHPNIAAIYEVGVTEAGATEGDDGRSVHFLVMELAEGETLQERLSQGALSIDQGLDLGRQIATALEAAHERGVIHRDLKPANVKITPEGQVKVLDFGLAKAWGPSDGGDVAESPTLTAQMTQAGVILGTAAYMSPEQARGGEVDKRTDIWSFGCVLFEILTGRQSFSGHTVTDILAAVVKEQPDLSLLPDAVPRRVTRLIERSLQKTAQDRLRDIGDARIELTPRQVAAPTPDTAAVAAASSSKFGRREAASWILSLLLLAVLGWVMFGGTSAPVEDDRAEREVMRFRMTQPGIDLNVGGFNQSLLAISPDGRQIVHPARMDGEASLVLRSLDSLEVRTIPESQWAFDPLFSADGLSLGFFSGFNGQLRTAPIKGLLPTDLAPVGQNRGGSWADDGSIVFAPNFSSGLRRVWPATGESVSVTEPDEEALEKSHRWPDVLPGSRTVLFTVLTSQIQSSDEAHIDAVDLTTGERKTVLRNASFARYSRPDRLLFVRGSHLLAVPFDPETVEVTGQPEVVVQNIVTLPLAAAALYDISESGTLIYVAGGPLAFRERIHRFAADLSSTVVSEHAEPFQTLRLSPDERFLAVGIDAVNQAIWKLDLERDSMIRITHDWGHNDAEWLPDQREMILVSGRRGLRNFYRVAADGSGTSEPVEAVGTRKTAGSLTPDGTTYYYAATNAEGNWDLWSVPITGGPSEPFLQTPFNEGLPAVSPDGSWLAYMSDESGQNEIYVQPLDGSGGKIRVSTAGGFSPLWSKDGREIYFYQHGPTAWLVAVPVAGPAGIEIGSPRRLLDVTYAAGAPRSFDTTRDGGFYILLNDTPDYPSEPVVVVHNWTAELD